MRASRSGSGPRCSRSARGSPSIHSLTTYAALPEDLIEILTVVGILVLLSAMLLVAVGKVFKTEQGKANDQTVNKIQVALDQQWKAVIDQCMQDRIQKKIPTALISYCDNDESRAEVVWTYANLKREFPQTPQYGASKTAGHEGNTDYLFERRELEKQE